MEFLVFDGSAPIQSGAFFRWLSKQLDYMETATAEELLKSNNSSRYLKKWYEINIRKFPNILDKKFKFSNLFKKRALYIFSKNLIYVEIQNGKDIDIRAHITHSGINFMYGNLNKRFEDIRLRVISQYL